MSELSCLAMRGGETIANQMALRSAGEAKDRKNQVEDQINRARAPVHDKNQSRHRERHVETQKTRPVQDLGSLPLSDELL